LYFAGFVGRGLNAIWREYPRDLFSSSTHSERKVTSLVQKNDPEHISAILKQLFSDPEWDKHLRVSLLLLRWQELVGSQIAKQSQPEFLKDDVLQVRVENPVWLNHLRFLGEELRQKINKKLYPQLIKEIRFRQGPLELDQPPPPSADEGALQSSRSPAKPLTPLSPEQQKLLDTVADSELRRDLEALLRKQQEHSHT